jgi:hypothetical protein
MAAASDPSHVGLMGRRKASFSPQGRARLHRAIGFNAGRSPVRVFTRRRAHSDPSLSPEIGQKLFVLSKNAGRQLARHCSRPPHRSDERGICLTVLWKYYFVRSFCHTLCAMEWHRGLCMCVSTQGALFKSAQGTTPSCRFPCCTLLLHDEIGMLNLNDWGLINWSIFWERPGEYL